MLANFRQKAYSLAVTDIRLLRQFTDCMNWFFGHLEAAEQAVKHNIDGLSPYYVYTANVLANTEQQ